MANTIERAEKFVPVIDEIYKQASKTAILDAQTKLDFTGTNAVKVLKIETTGLGDYSKDTGYPKGDVTATWETMTLTEDRGKEISIDRMDDEETLGQAFGGVMGQFLKTQVVPELDAYRFAAYATKAGASVEATFTTGAELLKAIDAASAEMDNKEVPEENRVLFISSALKPLLMDAFERKYGNDAVLSRTIQIYNSMPIVFVPQGRFYTGITANDGSSAWGFTKNGSDINFMIVEKESVLQVQKMALPKIFDPDTNQEKDAWKFQYRLYHDALVYENKVDGIYVSKKTA
jgi:hypothetical protein